MTINLIGQRNITGMGIHYSNFSDCIKSLWHISGISKEFNRSSNDEMNRLASGSSFRDVNIWFLGFSENLKQYIKGFNIVWSIFESDKLSDSYISAINKADLIWVPSRWGKATLERHGIPSSQVEVIPEGVKSSIFHPYARAFARREKNDKFRFLIIGKFEARKGYDKLLEAFRKVFCGNEKVELIIKGDYFIDHEKKKIALEEFIGSFGCNNIKTFYGVLSEKDLPFLYYHADAFVFPSRAEGWGLPLIEAIATGTPIVATNYSGHSEFLSEINGMYQEVRYKIGPIDDEEFAKYWPSPTREYGNWADPSAESLADLMRDVYENKEKCGRDALMASEIIRQKFDWSVGVNKAIASITKREIIL